MKNIPMKSVKTFAFVMPIYDQGSETYIDENGDEKDSTLWIPDSGRCAIYYDVYVFNYEEGFWDWKERSEFRDEAIEYAKEQDSKIKSKLGIESKENMVVIGTFSFIVPERPQRLIEEKLVGDNVYLPTSEREAHSYALHKFDYEEQEWIEDIELDGTKEMAIQKAKEYDLSMRENYRVTSY